MPSFTRTVVLAAACGVAASLSFGAAAACKNAKGQTIACSAKLTVAPVAQPAPKKPAPPPAPKKVATPAPTTLKPNTTLINTNAKPLVGSNNKPVATTPAKGGKLIGNSGGTIISTNGGGIVASGAGNNQQKATSGIVASGAGNLKH